MDQGELGSTAIIGTADTAPTIASPKLRPFKCPHCKVSFKRVDHLKRHIQLRMSALARIRRSCCIRTLAYVRQILSKCNINVPAEIYFLESISTSARNVS